MVCRGPLQFSHRLNKPGTGLSDEKRKVRRRERTEALAGGANLSRAVSPTRGNINSGLRGKTAKMSHRGKSTGVFK